MSNHKLSIVFYVNGMAFNGDSLKTHSLGGSETASLCMARELAKRGHAVSMFCNTDAPGKYEGVSYIPIDAFHQYMTVTPADVLITQRLPQIYNTQFKSKINILWMHDLALKRARREFRGSLWNIDEIWGVSEFHIDQMAEIYQADKKVFWQTRNGIDAIKDFDLKRKPKRLIYTARPERGMDILLNDIMPQVWEKDPDIELRLSGYDNTVPQMKPFYDSLYAKIEEHKNKGFKVEWLGALTKEQLYREYQQATLYVYPTDFEEVSCITAMECMANGLPMVTSGKAALPETLDKDAGVFVDVDIRSDEGKAEFAETLLATLKDADKTTSMVARGKEVAEGLSWEALALDWERHFYGIFKEKTANKETLARHFYRNEDIMALRKLDDPAWNARIAKEYPLIDNPAAFGKVYDELGKEVVDKIKNIHTHPRVVSILNTFVKPTHLLDYAGGIGNEAIQIVNQFDCNITTVDISAAQQEAGKELAKEHCKHPEKIEWIAGDSPDVLGTRKFDVVFAGEILEHMPRPHKLVDELEAHCMNGGQVVFTVPFGPWGDTDAKLTQKGHLWSFDGADIKELFKEKQDLKINVVTSHVNPKCKEPLGWFIVSYVKNDACKTGRINLNRKVAFQAPRQTVSACMIIGGHQEGLLHRCLKSIYPVVDEIIITDNGMSDATREVLTHYDDNIKMFDGPNPLEEGFDVARNESIKHATCDWILWIDSDEELLTAENMFKYLRSNLFNGYSIRQHHFSAQPPNAFKADLPIRLFRRNAGAKFFGYVHEHPELALNEGMGESTILSDVDIAHDGYLTEEGRRGRFHRNIGLMMKDREKYPDRILGKFLMMRDWIHLVRYTREQIQGRITPQIVEWCESVIEMYQTDFLGEDTMLSSDGLEFYSEALRTLGRGLEYSIGADVNTDPNQLNGQPVIARFATPEDAKDFMAARIDAIGEPFEGRYV